MTWPLNPLNRVRIRHIPGQRVTYLENPKVATRTIESSMWDAHAPGEAPDNPHEAADRAPFLTAEQMVTTPGLDELLSAEFLTVARNPYARFLSAYLDKVMLEPWERIAPQFGFTPDVRPPPRDLLAAMADLDPNAVNPHFRLQHLTVFHGLAPLEHVGHMEDMAATFEWLTEQEISPRDPPRPYATGANNLITERLEIGALHRIEEYYAEDFERFGYKDDPNVLPPVSPPELGAGSREALRDALARA